MAGALKAAIGLLPTIAMALSLPAVGAGAMYAWDRRAPHSPCVSFHVLWLHPNVCAPDSLKAQLDTLKDAEAAAGRHAVVVQKRQADISADVETHQGAELRRVGAVVASNAREIPLVIPPAVDRLMPLSVGFVRAHDAAARGVDLSEVAGPPGVPDDAPSVVKPSDLAGIINANYGDCHADAAELAGWQDWYARIRAAAAQP